MIHSSVCPHVPHSTFQQIQLTVRTVQRTRWHELQRSFAAEHARDADLSTVWALINEGRFTEAKARPERLAVAERAGA